MITAVTDGLMTHQGEERGEDRSLDTSPVAEQATTSSCSTLRTLKKRWLQGLEFAAAARSFYLPGATRTR